jgi:hypothetical protein
MAKGKLISYLRVSTDKRGCSGLGLRGTAISRNPVLNGGNWTVVAEYVETESGKRSDRPKLAAALVSALERGGRGRDVTAPDRRRGVLWYASSVRNALERS